MTTLVPRHQAVVVILDDGHDPLIYSDADVIPIVLDLAHNSARAAPLDGRLQVLPSTLSELKTRWKIDFTERQPELPPIPQPKVEIVVSGG